jgi:hypothetical protein
MRLTLNQTSEVVQAFYNPGNLKGTVKPVKMLPRIAAMSKVKELTGCDLREAKLTVNWMFPI